MRTVTREVYYCDFCKRHRLTRASIERHEPRCIYNPSRSVCGWHHGKSPADPSVLVPAFKDDPDIDWLRVEADGCPACMLAVVVQARLLGLHSDYAYDFVYRAEVERFRAVERDQDRVRVW